jgi:hypothetical protein
MAAAIDATDAGPEAAAHFLVNMFEGLGDACEIQRLDEGGIAVVQDSLRIVRGLEADLRPDLLACWNELWRGAIHAHRTFMNVTHEPQGDGQIWTIRPV